GRGERQGGVKRGRQAPAGRQRPRLSGAIPEAVALGFHFGFGTFGGWPAYARATLDATVALANAVIAGSGRRVD
ncbi:MAG: hypothetical protein ACREFQ_04355, partial [Stellaceae bacterium]